MVPRSFSSFRIEKSGSNLNLVTVTLNYNKSMLSEILMLSSLRPQHCWKNRWTSELPRSNWPAARVDERRQPRDHRPRPNLLRWVILLITICKEGTIEKSIFGMTCVFSKINVMSFQMCFKFQECWKIFSSFSTKYSVEYFDLHRTLLTFNGILLKFWETPGMFDEILQTSICLREI